jgi:hypothetical protein
MWLCKQTLLNQRMRPAAKVLAKLIRWGGADSSRFRTNVQCGQLAHYDSTLTHGDGASNRCLARLPWSLRWGATDQRTRRSLAGRQDPCRIDGSQEVAHPPKTQQASSHLFRGVLKRQRASNEPGRVVGASGGAGT